MAKKANIQSGTPRLFEQHERATERRLRRSRAIFIPKYVREVAAHAALSGPARDKAHATVVKWAELESSGQLEKHKETSIDTQFLDDVFGSALGYALKTDSPEDFQLEHKPAVKGMGTADATLGLFPAAVSPTVVIELKGAMTDLDRDRSNGRTAVQQCWDYLNVLPQCPWGIVSNFSEIRLYHRSKGMLAYEAFTLQELRDADRFAEFYAIFERGGLLPSKLAQTPRALALLERTEKRQKEVGDDLYKAYQWRRWELIDHLITDEGKELDEAIRIAQRLLDRIIFIAFCEDRGLLPEKTLETTKVDIDRYSRARNPAWENFLRLFVAIDKGAKGKVEITAYNGGLFAQDAEIDALELEDPKWTEAFANFGTFDFSEEVNVEVLGHLFERSITELEKLRIGGVHAFKANFALTPSQGSSARPAKNGRAKKSAADSLSGESPLSKMPKSAERKRFGIYYTPPAFTSLIVERTVDRLVEERFDSIAASHKINLEAKKGTDPKKLAAFWRECLAALKTVTICDPACGSGAFLIRAYDAMEEHYKTVAFGLGGPGGSKEESDALLAAIPDLILNHNLFGVDLSAQGVEITQLALWIRSARKGKTLANLSAHIVHGNSLVHAPGVDAKALDWHKAFPGIFGKGGPGGFSCVIGNPPWERVKVQDREFFALTDPKTAQAVSAADRRKRIAAMPTENPDLHAAYERALTNAGKLLDYARNSEAYPLTGKGDVNLYMLFAERAMQLVAPDGLVGLLVPSGVATDDTTKEFFNDLMDRKCLISLYDFENRKGHFADVDGRFKFTALVCGGKHHTTEQADFVFFAHDVDETAAANKQRHIALTAADMKLLNPNTKTCPIFRTRRDADLTRGIYKRVPILIDENRRQGGNPWGIKFFTMFHQTNDAEHFRPAAEWKKDGYRLHGNVYAKKGSKALPLYEAKMVQAFDHRAASVVVEGDNWVRQGQKEETSTVQHQNPEFCVLPRWWVEERAVDVTLEGNPGNREWFMGFKDITSPTNERTMIASFVPRAAVTNKFVLALTDAAPRLSCCLLSNFNAIVFDYVTRQKIGGITLNFFIVEQLPTLAPDVYADKCPWNKKETLEHWISERVLKLSCTAEDMIPLAKACDFKGGRGDGVHLWKDQERHQLRAELDAAYFHLYGVEREDAEYMLSTFTGTGFIEPDQRLEKDHAWTKGSIGESILDAYDALAAHR